MSFRITPELDKKIDDLAAAIDRPRSYVVEQAVEEYVARQAWQVAAIKKGIADADAGLLIPDEEIRAWIESLGTKHEKPRPTARGKPPRK
ncbi:MAG: CopG family ribbon-helix-helix protein [Alphaproteobacteria bacterium]